MYSNGIAKVDIQGVLEFVRGREDFVELVRRHMGDDCAQLVRELSQEVKAAEDKAFYDGFCYCFQRIEKELGGDERIAGALRKARQKVDRKYIRGDAWDDSFAVERMAALERRYQESIEEIRRNHQAEITRLESVIAHQAEQVKEMAVYKARAEAGGGTQAQERRRAKGVYRGAEEGKADANCIYHALQGGRIRFCRHDSI